MEIRKAFIKSLPVMAGYIVLGIGFGILLRNEGYGVLWAFSMSLLIYAGSMQYAGISLISGAASVFTVMITTVMINARHLFYSISMIEKYKDAGIYKPYLIFALTDETYSLMADGNVPSGCNPDRYRFFVSMFNHLYWIGGSVLGSVIGKALPFSTRGIEFSMTALFAASFAEQWVSSHEHIPALTGICITGVSLMVFGPNRFLIPAMIGILVLLTICRRRIS